MPKDDPSKQATTPDQDAARPLSGRQAQRPGQHGRYQPRPGERDQETLPSAEEAGFAGQPPARGQLPSSWRPRRGSRPPRG